MVIPTYKKSSLLGFTLVELIVVIAIIGLLATVGISSYTNILHNARDTKRKADLKEFVDAVKSFQIRNGRGPAEVGYCQSSIGNSSDTCPPQIPTYEWEQNQTWTDLVSGGYLERLPLDPLNNDTYYYWYEPYNPGSVINTGWRCPSTRPWGDCGGWIQAYLETSSDPYMVYWPPPY